MAPLRIAGNCRLKIKGLAYKVGCTRNRTGLCDFQNVFFTAAIPARVAGRRGGPYRTSITKPASVRLEDADVRELSKPGINRQLKSIPLFARCCSRAALLVLLTTPALAQGRSASDARGPLDFPILMQQKIAAGITPVGAEVEAKLTEATLADGVVIPRGAILSGRVEESSAKTADAPSRIRIKFDSARWKEGSAGVDAYLTSDYYTSEEAQQPDLSMPSAVHGSAGVTMGGARPEPPGPGGVWTGRPDVLNDPGMGDDPGTGPLPPRPPSLSRSSTHKQRLPGMETTKSEDGSVTVTSKKHSIRLDKSTTYVLETARAKKN
jgi:hypothetical protein